MVQIDEKDRKYGIELLDKCLYCSHCPVECWKYDDSLKARVLHIRDVSEEEAILYISNFLKEQKGKEIYTSNILDELGIELDLVIKICKDLEEEGAIQVCD